MQLEKFQGASICNFRQVNCNSYWALCFRSGGSDTQKMCCSFAHSDKSLRDSGHGNLADSPAVQCHAALKLSSEMSAGSQLRRQVCSCMCRTAVHCLRSAAELLGGLISRTCASSLIFHRLVPRIILSSLGPTAELSQSD